MYFSRFMPTTDLGGGSRRLMQMLEIFRDLRCELVSAPRGDRISTALRSKIRGKSVSGFLPGYTMRGMNMHRWHPVFRQNVYRLGALSQAWSRSIPEIAALDMVFMDDPVYFRPLLKILYRKAIPVAAISHNVESLVCQQTGTSPAFKLLEREIKILLCCRLVVTISREEDILLKNLGVSSLFLPYYPAEPILTRLEAVREARRHSAKEGVLLIGTALNTPTREGMIQAARYWQEHRLDRYAGKLLIAGFSSEKYFTPDQFGGGVEFVERLTNDELDCILSRVKAGLCYQSRGAGALTRICEMLIAGVPVLANSHAARSYYNRTGVIEFRALCELDEAIQQIDALEGRIALPPAPDMSYLFAELKKIVTG